jgi:hypothetical protein
VHCSAGQLEFIIHFVTFFNVERQAAVVALQLCNAIPCHVHPRASRVALLNSGQGSGGSPIVCVDPSHVEEMSSDALATAAGAEGEGGALQLTAVRIEARSGLLDEDVRALLSAVCDALKVQLVGLDKEKMPAVSPSSAAPQEVSSIPKPLRDAADDAAARVSSETYNVPPRSGVKLVGPKVIELFKILNTPCVLCSLRGW